MTRERESYRGRICSESTGFVLLSGERQRGGGRYIESSSTYTENEQTADITPRHVLAVAVIDSLDTT
jgi:hypothetical protein